MSIMLAIWQLVATMCGFVLFLTFLILSATLLMIIGSVIYAIVAEIAKAIFGK